MKENATSPTTNLQLEMPSDDSGIPCGISSSGLALQQSEHKKETVLSFLDSRKHSSFKQLENVLDEHTAGVVCRYLASSRTLTKSFDIYLQKVSTLAPL